MAEIAFGGLKNIVEIVEKVQEAVEKVKRNKKECCDIETYLTVCSNVLLELQEKTEIMKRKDICKALLKVQGSFNEVLTLVLECELVHGVSISCWGYIKNLWKAGDWEKDLSKVKEDIGSHMRLAHLAAEAHISIQLQQLFTGKKGSSSSYLTLPPARTPPPANDQLRRPVTVGRGGLKVVLLYAFDCTNYTPAWFKMEEEVFWLVHEKLADFPGSWLGYIYVMSKPNTYTCDMKLVDPADTKATGYRASSLWHRKSCTENMACGLTLAHELISDDDGDSKGIILHFSDGSIHNKGNFFDGAEKFKSKVPVHTFTLGGNNAYDEGLRCIAANSHGGTFNPTPVPDKQMLSSPFSNLLDSILGRTKNPSGRGGLKVVVLYAFDCTDSTPDWYKMEKVFWVVHEKLVHLDGSWLGYIYVMSKPNTYTCDMKLVDSADKEATGYHSSSFWHRRSCTPDKASGLKLAHELISHDGDHVHVSDGSIDNKDDFFDGAKKFKSEVPVHTFTLGGAAYNEGLRCIAANSHGGTFDPSPVPAEPKQSPFSTG